MGDNPGTKAREKRAKTHSNKVRSKRWNERRGYYDAMTLDKTGRRLAKTAPYGTPAYAAERKGRLEYYAEEANKKQAAQDRETDIDERN
jgi:hypothetical protein